MVVDIILSSVVLYLVYKVWKLKKDFNKKTYLYWESQGDFKVLKNGKGEQILKL